MKKVDKKELSRFEINSTIDTYFFINQSSNDKILYFYSEDKIKNESDDYRKMFNIYCLKEIP